MECTRCGGTIIREVCINCGFRPSEALLEPLPYVAGEKEKGRSLAGKSFLCVDCGELIYVRGHRLRKKKEGFRCLSCHRKKLPEYAKLPRPNRRKRIVKIQNIEIFCEDFLRMVLKQYGSHSKKASTCPICGDDSIGTALVDVLYKFEPCSCGDPEYTHLVQQMYHIKCYEESVCHNFGVELVKH